VLCIYCLRSDADTVDHVPPKILLPKPFPKDLITVPSCRACNKSFEKDDEYFRAALTARVEVDGIPEGKAVLDRMLRGLSRPEAAGLRTMIVSSATMRKVFSPEGIYLGDHPALEVDTFRIARSLGRMARALYWKEKGVPLPRHVETRAHIELDRDEYFVALTRKMLAGRPLRAVGTAFRFMWNEAPDPQWFTAWLLEFYGSVQFVVMTVDPDLVPNLARKRDA
jgi:hypothetical protein